MRNLSLFVLKDHYAVARLPPEAALPPWLTWVGFASVTHSEDELSIVCRQRDIPADAVCERGWRCLRVEGRLDFALIGVLHSVARPLAEAGVSVFAVSTYDTDYILVKAERFDSALAALSRAGHTVRVEGE